MTSLLIEVVRADRHRERNDAALVSVAAHNVEASRISHTIPGGF